MTLMLMLIIRSRMGLINMLPAAVEYTTFPCDVL